MSDDARALDLDERPRRQQSQTERDLAGIAARRERNRASPARGVPEFTTDELTGNYQGEDLARMRARRPTPNRLERLEKKQDEDRAEIKTLTTTVSDLRVDVANIDGKLDVLPELLQLIRGKSADDNKTTRHIMTTRAKVILAVVGLVGTALGILGTSLSGCA
jgi:uncharacterized coiled-coil protein SlyX